MLAIKDRFSRQLRTRLKITEMGLGWCGCSRMQVVSGKRERHFLRLKTVSKALR